MKAAFELLKQCAASAGVELQVVEGVLKVDKSSTKVQAGAETHGFPWDGDTTKVQAIMGAVGDVQVTTSTGALLVTLPAEQVPQLVEALKP